MYTTVLYKNFIPTSAYYNTVHALCTQYSVATVLYGTLYRYNAVHYVQYTGAIQ